MDKLTADGKCFYGLGVGIITLAADDMNPAKADVLIVDSQLLRFDLIVGVYIIKMLGGVRINKFGKDIFSRMRPKTCIL